jgi:hypothetical protein
MSLRVASTDFWAKAVCTRGDEGSTEKRTSNYCWHTCVTPIASEAHFASCARSFRRSREVRCKRYCESSKQRGSFTRWAGRELRDGSLGLGGRRIGRTSEGAQLDKRNMDAIGDAIGGFLVLSLWDVAYKTAYEVIILNNCGCPSGLWQYAILTQ